MKTAHAMMLVGLLVSWMATCHAYAHDKSAFHASKPLFLPKLQEHKPTKEKALAQEENFGYQLLGKRKWISLPFQLQANLIVIRLKINNSDTLNFILDTGVSSLIVTDPNCLKNQQLKPVRKVKIAGTGEGNDIEASIVLNNTIRLGNMEGYRQNLVVLSEDKIHLSEFVGSPIHGIIGQDIFSRFVVTIDFATREIILYSPEYYRYKKSKGERFPITIEDGKPYLSALEVVDGDKAEPIKVILDTGAGHALSLENNDKGRIQLPSKMINAQLGRGLSGIINGKIGRVKQLRIGKYTLENLVASFPDSNSYKSAGYVKAFNRHGNIGCEFLRRFKITFNYRESYIVLKTSRKRLKEPFEHNMAGLELMAKGNDFRDYRIDRIEDNSPAQDAGLQEGDKVLFINNTASKDISITDIYKMLQKGEGKSINFVVSRNGQLIVTTLKLRRVI